MNKILVVYFTIKFINLIFIFPFDSKYYKLSQPKLY